MNTNYDIVIIGGGISGLSFANFLAQMDRKVLILEKSERTGGAIESLCYEDFHIDIGTHTAYNSYTTLLELTENCSIQKDLQARKKQHYFFATNKGFQKIFKLLNFTSLFTHIPHSFSTSKEYKNVKEYFSKILGNKNYNNFAQHFFKAVLCQNADNYPANFFLKRRKKRNSNFPKSFTFQKGMQCFSDALLNHKNITIRTEVKVQNIEKQEDIFLIETTKGNYQVKDIAFATYANAVSKLTKNIAPNLSCELSKITYQTVSSLGIILKKDSVTHLKEFAGLLTTSDDYTSIVSRDIAPHSKYRGFTIHAQGQVSEEKLQEILCKTLAISSENILAKHYKNSQLPKLQKGHEDLLDNLESLIGETLNIYVTGNYFQGLSLEDCLLRSKKEALRYISTP